MLERSFHLKAAAADVGEDLSGYFDNIRFFDGLAWLLSELSINEDKSGGDQALGAFTALGQTARCYCFVKAFRQLMLQTAKQPAMRY